MRSLKLRRIETGKDKMPKKPRESTVSGILLVVIFFRFCSSFLPGTWLTNYYTNDIMRTTKQEGRETIALPTQVTRDYLSWARSLCEDRS